jgi:hypothetical protein
MLDKHTLYGSGPQIMECGVFIGRRLFPIGIAELWLDICTLKVRDTTSCSLPLLTDTRDTC